MSIGAGDFSVSAKPPSSPKRGCEPLTPCSPWCCIYSGTEEQVGCKLCKPLTAVPGHGAASLKAFVTH